MNILPPLQPYEGLHPLVVHFPIALLLVAPVFVVLGLLWRSIASPMFLSAIVLLVIGTVGAFLAVSTGEAAEDFVVKSAAIEATLSRHESLAELSRNLFVAVTIVGALLAGMHWRWRAKVKPAVVWGVGVAFLAAHGAASIVLANAAHEGGRLVHEHGVRSSTTVAPVATPRHHEDD